MISWFQSRTSCSTVIEGKVAGSTSWGTRPSTSAAVGIDDAARRCPGGDDGRRRAPPTNARNSAPRSSRAGAPPTRRSVAGSAAASARAGRARSSRSRSGRPAQTTASPPSSATFVPNSSVCGAMSERAGHGDEEAEHDPAAASGRHGLRVGDHEEQEDQDLGRGDDHPPVVEAADRRERPAGDHAMARRGEHADARGQGEPERRRRRRGARGGR